MGDWFIRPIKGLLLLSLLLSASPLPAQMESVPLSHWIYDWLERWYTAGMVDPLFLHTRPYSREEVARYLVQVRAHYQQAPSRFSEVDQRKLAYALAEFAEALPDRQGAGKLPVHRYRFRKLLHTAGLGGLSFLYPNQRNMLFFHHQQFRLYADPIFQFSRREFVAENGQKSSETRRSNGFMFRGSLGNHLGFLFMLTDNNLKQTPPLPRAQVLEESGFPFLQRRQNGSVDFDENIAALYFRYRFFHFTFGREFNEWGVGHRGQLMLSSNAPVYDQLKLVVRYWRFRFTHLTAFLEYIHPRFRQLIYQSPPIDVYWAGNRLELDAGKGLLLGFSESVVYGNRSLDPGYLNPIGFFASLEHFYGDRDNTALAVDFSWRIAPGIRLFGEWFIDDITIGKLGTRWVGNKFAYQGGFFLVDPLHLASTDLLFEYTRIKPYVYSHTLRDYNKYKHYDTVLGHFIGPNSEHAYLRARWYPHYRLRIQLEGEWYRHGSNPADRNVGGDPDFPFRFDVDREDPIFLDGLRVQRTAVGAQVRYEWLRRWYLLGAFYRVKVPGVGWHTAFQLQTSFHFGFREEPFRVFQTARQ